MAQPPARHVIVHLSDTHLLAGNPPLGGRYDTAANLEATLAAIERTGARPTAIVVTGDLTDLGEPDAYIALRRAFEPFSERLEAPIVWVAGNHDERPAMRAGLFGLPESDEAIVSAESFDGLRIIALDTTVPGWHHGDLDDRQLDWLRDELSRPAEHGTLLAMHHPPLPSHVPLFDILELQNQDALAEVVRGSDVRAILAGHLHYSMSGTFAGIPVSVASATCYTMDIALPAEHVNGMDAGQSFHLVHVYDETVTHSVVPVVDAEAAEFFSPEWYRSIQGLSRQEQLELFSRKRPIAQG
jgi:3',5'-cyclic-AMP phosphodiesterase